MGATKNIQNVRQVDATNSAYRRAIDSSGRAAIQNPPNLDVAASTLATETKLEAVRALLQTIDADTSKLDVNLSTVATDTVLQAVRDRIGEISGTPTANTVMDRLKELEATLTSLDGKDYATQTTLASVLTKLTEIDTAIDSIDGKVATETTLQGVNTRLGEVQESPTQYTLLERIKTLFTKLTEIDTVLDAINLTTGIKKIVDALPIGDNIIGRVKVTDGTDVQNVSTGGQAHTVLYDDANNVALAVADAVAVPANTRHLLVGGIDQTGDARRLELIEDTQEVGLYRLATTGKVSITIPPPPEGGVKISISADDPLEISQSTSPYLTEWEIDDGKTLNIQQIIAGCQGDPSADGSKVEVYYWDGTDEHLIDRIYVVGQTQFGNYPDTNVARDDEPLVGMPTAGEGTIRIYRSRLSNSAQEIDCVIRGYTI
jgi:hypothetical protein